MPWSLLWAYAALLHSGPSPACLAAGLAAVLLAVVLAAAVVAASALPGSAGVPRLPGASRRTRTRSVPRSVDPDAAGRPRSRAPSAALSAA
jgi:hypothetical protein